MYHFRHGKTTKKAEVEERKCDHATLVAAKEKEVATLTATIETNFGDLESGAEIISEIQKIVGPREIWFREDQEKDDALLFRYVGIGARLALCSVGWLTTRKVLRSGARSDRLGAWLVLLDRGEPCGSCQDTTHEAAFRGQARVKFASSRSGSGPTPRPGVVSLLFHAPSQVHWKGSTTLVKLLNDDDGSRKQGLPCGHLARHISKDTLVASPLFLRSLSWSGFATASERQRRRRLCDQCRRAGEDAELCRSRWCT